MIVLLIIIYIIGALATGILLWREIPSGRTITMADLGIAIFLVTLSWVSFIIGVIDKCSDIVIFRKK